jgi:hypothetical protein
MTHEQLAQSLRHGRRVALKVLHSAWARHSAWNGSSARSAPRPRYTTPTSCPYSTPASRPATCTIDAARRDRHAAGSSSTAKHRSPSARTAEAIRAGRRAVALPPLTTDAASGPFLQTYLAQIYLLTCELDKAAATLHP